MTQVSIKTQTPTHIGFIMDGNRHWADANHKTLEQGYLEGAEAMVQAVYSCIDAGVKHMTVYAFSTENRRRPEDQKSLLMTLFKEGVEKRLAEFIKMGVRINFIGRVSDFPQAVQLAFQKAQKLTKDGQAIILNVAVSYGGRAEIVDATKRIIADGLSPEEVTEEKFSSYIYEAGQPDPDLIVRTSGEKRLSGFMLWQSFYSELYFTDKNWPDFNKEEFAKALSYYQEAKRNFGK